MANFVDMFGTPLDPYYDYTGTPPAAAAPAAAIPGSTINGQISGATIAAPPGTAQTPVGSSNAGAPTKITVNPLPLSGLSAWFVRGVVVVIGAGLLFVGVAQLRGSQVEMVRA